MTIGEYMINPYGKGASFAATSLQREQLEQDYPALQAYIKTHVYQIGKDIIFHIQIPSRKSNRVLYDVIIEIEAGATDLRPVNYSTSELMVFSNCPSFAYSYANLFYRQGYLCKWLYDKYPRAMRKHPAEERNPHALIGYERSLYLALYHLRKTGLFVSRTAIVKVLKKTKKEVFNLVKDLESVENDYKVFTSIDKEREAQRQAKIKKHLPPPRKNPNDVSAFYKASKTNRVGRVGKITKTNKTKKF